MRQENVLAKEILQPTLEYLINSQDFTPGEYHGAFWSEKAYHGPLLDWNAGGSHHHRGTASAALALYLEGKSRSDHEMTRNAELAFDWLAARQHERGGWFEIQNNEKPSDWELTGLDELSTISTAFAAHGLGRALLNGLPPKKSYLDCLIKAGHWFLSIEWPAASGVFPHHERSPYDTLNANAHSVESLALIFQCLNEVYDRRVNIFLQGAVRGFTHTLPLHWENGCYPYRKDIGSTINYTSLVLWCFLNTLDILPNNLIAAFLNKEELDTHFGSATSFLCSCVNADGSLEWNENETSSAKHNIWTYAITHNVFSRMGGDENNTAAERILKRLSELKTTSGLLPMRDEGPEITECLFMQADIFLFLRSLPL